jgi:hypothetical protein
LLLHFICGFILFDLLGWHQDPNALPRCVSSEVACAELFCFFIPNLTISLWNAQVKLDYRPVGNKTLEPGNNPVPPAKRVY